MNVVIAKALRQENYRGKHRQREKMGTRTGSYTASVPMMYHQCTVWTKFTVHNNNNLLPFIFLLAHRNHIFSKNPQACDSHICFDSSVISMKQDKSKSSSNGSKKPNSGKPNSVFKTMAIAANKKKALENPFDKFSNSKKKHDVLNRKVKGEDRNVGRAREKAIDERKTKLMKDYQSNKKSNSFMDKRFGESDTNLSLEEKMFMRFQQERVKKVRNGSLFNLDSNDTEVLTHKGQQLGASNLDDQDWVESDDEGGNMDKDVVNKLHFGGGMIETNKSSKNIYGPQDENNDEGGDDAPRKQGRLEALQEIVMKSKLHKMQRKEAKDEQEDERNKLDKAFDSLFATSQIKIVKPEKSTYRARDGLEGCDGNDAYDVSLREMAYEGKAQPSDRTKTAEEIAVQTVERVEELERARIRRMKHAIDPSGELLLGVGFFLTVFFCAIVEH